MLMLPYSLLWTGVVCLCEWLKHVASAGSLQVIPIRICILLPLLPLPPIWWQARLCLFEENFPWSLHSWGYTPKCWAFEFLGSVSLSIQIVYCAPKGVGPFHEELFLWDFQLLLSMRVVWADIKLSIIFLLRHCYNLEQVSSLTMCSTGPFWSINNHNLQVAHSVLL
jgi:hypothetical protein